MESQTNGVPIKTGSIRAKAMLHCVHLLISRYNVKEIDSISCDRELMGFRVHFTEAKDSKRFENGLFLEYGSSWDDMQLVINSPSKEMGKYKKIKQTNEYIKEEPGVRSSTRSSKETTEAAGPSSETTTRQDAKCKREEAMPNSKTKKQKTTEDDVSGINKWKTMADYCYFPQNNKATLEGNSFENWNYFPDEKGKVNPSHTYTPFGPSHVVTPPSSSKLRAADTSILSDELQGYINHACKTIGALDRQTLDAFLGHVWKKNNPTQIALKYYTPDVKKLKHQLEMILTLRFRNVVTNRSKEDSAFINWLDSLMSRFDNTKPSKRKKPGQY